MINFKTNFYDNIDFLQVTIILFTACNLNCKFCFQKHANDIDYNDIINIKSISNEIIKKLEHNHKIKQVSLHFMGGQLFMDSISDNIFEAYKFLYNSIFNDIHSFNKNINIMTTWLSNGIFHNKSRIQNFLNETHTLISFSYDPIDRYTNQNQKDLLLNNLYYFNNKKLLSVLSITITKPSMDYYLKSNELIDFMNNGIAYIDMSLYSPNTDYEKYIFSDDDLFIFFKYIIDNKIYSIKFVNRFLQQMLNKNIPILRQCICKNNLGYYKKNISYDCVKRSSCLPKQNFYGKYTDYVTQDNCNQIALQIGLNKRGCNFCQWYDKCMMPCWTSYIFKYNKQNTVCPYKRIFQYISKNTFLIQDFKNDYFETKC